MIILDLIDFNMYRLAILFNSEIPFDSYFEFDGSYVIEWVVTTFAPATGWFDRQEDEFSILYWVDTDV